MRDSACVTVNSLLPGWYDDEVKYAEEIILEIQKQVYDWKWENLWRDYKLFCPFWQQRKKCMIKKILMGHFAMGSKKLCSSCWLFVLVAFVILVYSFSVYRTQGNWAGILQLALHTSVWSASQISKKSFLLHTYIFSTIRSNTAPFCQRVSST